jgi:hypothetical protein
VPKVGRTDLALVRKFLKFFFSINKTFDLVPKVGHPDLALDQMHY